MGLFDFFKKSKSDKTTGLNTESQISIAIEAFENNPNADWQAIVSQISKQLNDENLAFDLYRFIPIAYCRQFLNDVSFPSAYLTADTKGEFTVEHKFDDNKLFVTTERLVMRRFENKIGQDKIMNILRHSSDFNAINQALNNGS